MGKTMLDEKLFGIIEKAGEAGQLSWSALTTTILMTCILIIQGMARWEPCRAILQQMGIIEHLQVIKFKNSRDLASIELNDSSDNEKDENSGKNSKTENTKSERNREKRQKKQSENLKTQM